MPKLKKTESTTAHWQECRAARSHFPASVGCELAGYPESNLAGSRQAEGWPARTGITPHVGRQDIHARGQQRLDGNNPNAHQLETTLHNRESEPTLTTYSPPTGLNHSAERKEGQSQKNKCSVIP